MILNRQSILDVNDLTHEEIDIPEWGGTVRIRMLTGAERDEFEASFFDSKTGKTKSDLKNVRAKLISLCVVDENNTRIFLDSDVEKLGKKSGKVLSRIFAAAQALNGMRAEDIEATTKNSESGGVDTSTSPSPKN